MKPLIDIEKFLEQRPQKASNLIYLSERRLGQIERAYRIKRSFDIFVILISLPFTLPVFLILSILIYITNPGPVFYISKRVGRYGREFSFYKFRTMVVGADKMKEELMEKNESSDGVIFKMKKDPRITSIGRYLRKLSLDELPQLINVLCGDMSLVGPRPPVQSEVDEYTLEQRKRLHFVPGITCIWQISGRSDIPFEIQYKMDLEYINNFSISKDIKILFMTIPAVVFGKGAY